MAYVPSVEEIAQLHQKGMHTGEGVGRLLDIVTRYRTALELIAACGCKQTLGWCDHHGVAERALKGAE